MNEQIDTFEYLRMFRRDVPTDVSDVATDVSYAVTFGDRRPEVGYVVSPEVELAVNVALATGRPLLVLGPPGSGKTSLGFAVAERFQWDVYDVVVTSRTRAQDLLWTFDNVRRLSAALAARDNDRGGAGAAALSDEAYLGPGVLWWALDPQRAADIVAMQGKQPPKQFSAGAVLVIDEIDKADPGVPNDLLRPLGDLEFEVADLGHEQVVRQRKRPPLVFVISNGERTLPAAFIRRCVVIELPGFDRGRLLDIATKHFPKAEAERCENVLDELVALAPKDATGQPAIGAAEYLDVLRACLELGVNPGDAYWDQVSATALLKQPAREG